MSRDDSIMSSINSKSNNLINVEVRRRKGKSKKNDLLRIMFALLV